MKHSKDFAKIVQASDGRQVLFYVEPEGGDYLFHQVIQFDIGQVDMKIGFCNADAKINEDAAYSLLQTADTKHADQVIEKLREQLGDVLDEQESTFHYGHEGPCQREGCGLLAPCPDSETCTRSGQRPPCRPGCPTGRTRSICVDSCARHARRSVW